MRRPVSLRRRVVTAVVLVALGPTLALVAREYASARSTLERRTQERLAATARTAATAFDDYFSARLDAIRVNAALPSFRRALEANASFASIAEARQVLQTITRSEVVNVDDLMLLDTLLKTVASASDNPDTESSESPEAALALTSEFPVLGEPQRHSPTAQATFTMAAAVRTGGRVRGVLVRRYNAAVLDQLLAAIAATAPDGTQLLMVDSVGVVVASAGAPEVAIFTPTRPLDAQEAARRRFEGRLVDVAPLFRVTPETRHDPQDRNTASLGTFEGVGSGRSVESFGAEVSLKTLPWRAVMLQPTALVMAPAANDVRDALVLAAALVLTVGLAGWALSRRLAQPLEAMTVTARSFADGDMTARVDTGAAIIEYGVMAAAFNDLADRVSALLGRVAERTRELEADIRDRERLENELVQTRKLEAVGRLAGGVAHDFNNMLTVVLNNLELADAQLGPDDPARLDMLAAQEAARRAAGVTAQLLAFARRGSVRLVSLDLGQRVEALRGVLERMIGAAYRLDVRIEPALEPVRMDPSQFEQVVVNIVANARDAMPDGGIISLSLRVVESAEGDADLAPGKYAELTVQDQGVGMQPETAERLFEPFFTTKPLGQGTGLGLATVHGVVTGIGGRVAVDTAPGRGTTFHVWLPCDSSAPAEAPAPVEDQKLPRGSELVLVVEDEPQVREAVGRQLRALGYRVRDAIDGIDALAIIREADEQPAIVVSDVVMPRLGGIALARRLHDLRPQLPIMLMSGYFDASGESIGDWPLLQKPFTRIQLATAVRERLDAVLPPPPG